VAKQPQSNQSDTQNIIHIKAPGRLHLGFIDMHGGLGRSFGSLGLCLEEIYTHISAKTSGDVIIHGPSSHRASVYAGRILQHLNISKGAEINIHEAIPEHAGLGSGTQLSLAVGSAISRLYGKTISLQEIAKLMGRGARSGIGIGAFLSGGFLVDGGRGSDTDVPPVICRLHFPDSWRILLIFDSGRQGMHGSSETRAFRELPPMSEDRSAQMCRLTLMQLLPALAEGNCKLFGSAISEIQCHVGDHFAAAQGGRYYSPRVAEVLPWLSEQGATGIGQSSWGPTGFALFPNETKAYQALKKAREEWQYESSLSFKVCRARNQKAEISAEDVAGSRQFLIHK